jgi:micrococcal nuclease
MLRKLRAPARLFLRPVAAAVAVGLPFSALAGATPAEPQPVSPGRQRVADVDAVRIVDGDTFRYRGVRIRIADIDAPETHPPRCPREAQLGAAATRRMAELLGAGPFELVPPADGRDEDRFGRKLRRVVRGRASLGEQLVAEGLARPWGGARRPWCA